MSDEVIRVGNADEELEVGGGGGRGLFTGAFFQIFKWIAIIALATVFIVTVVYFSVNNLQPGVSRLTRVPDTVEFSAPPQILEWFSGIGELRGKTSDETRSTFIITPHIGFEVGDSDVRDELTARRIRIRDTVLFLLSSRTANELESVENRGRIKAELTLEINNLMRSGKIREVAFDQYQIVQF